jgi:hypothetical protein
MKVGTLLRACEFLGRLHCWFKMQGVISNGIQKTCEIMPLLGTYF